MYSKKLGTLAFFFLVISTCFGQGNPVLQQGKGIVEVIDFYGTHRCVTCKEIEANTKYVVDTYFSNEKKQGLVVFKTVNVDDEKNYKIAESFEAMGTALFLNVVVNGEEKHIDLTNFAFSKGRDKATFTKELKSKIEEQLQQL